jgi:hypothetical protein
MQPVELCRSRIASVRAAAADPESAYLLRTRLKRVILSCQMLVAEEIGDAAPRRPAYVEIPAAASPAHRAVAEATNRLFDAAVHLCQPSEALDLRWKTGWSRLQADLEHLDSCLTELTLPARQRSA